MIMWDEIMMSHVDQVDCVDRSLRDILPIVHHSYHSQIVKSCMHSSALWTQIQQLHLTTNMCVIPDEIDFAKYLLTLGNGTATVHPDIGEDMIQIPKKYAVKTMDELIERVFPGIENGYTDKYFVAHCAILTPINDNVDKINESIMDKFPGEGNTYLSVDSVAEEDLDIAYPTDFLNSITVSGMLPHAMTLKVGAPVMLLRNLRAGPGDRL